MDQEEIGLHNHNLHEDDEKQSCMVCLVSDVDATTGRLFRPCLCRWSRIHDTCLQDWRRTSSMAYKQCGVCRYRYRTSRPTYAKLLQHPLCTSVTTFVAVVSTVVLVCFFIRFAALVLLGARLSRSAFAVTRQLVWWSIMVIGLVTLIVACVFSDDRIDVSLLNHYSIGDLHTPGFQYILDGLSFAGFVCFIKSVYNSVFDYTSQLLTQVGDYVLEVKEDDQHL